MTLIDIQIKECTLEIINEYWIERNTAKNEQNTNVTKQIHYKFI